MIAIDFPARNGVLKPPKGMEENCGTLPVHHNNGKEVISCWEFTVEETRRILEGDGKVWLRVVGSTHPPVALEVESPFVETGAG